MHFVDLAILNRLSADLIQLSPMLVLVITATFILVIEALFPSDEALYTSLLSLWGIAMSTVAAYSQWQAPAGALFGGMLVVDRFTLFVEFLILAIGGITILLSTRFIRTSRLPSAEYSFFVLLSTAGMMLLSSSADLLMLFLSIETMSLALYVLVSYQVRDRLANEGAMKYLILGGFASGFLLYGIALMFGATGTTQIEEIGKMLLIFEKTNGLFWLSLLFLFIGLAFKIAAVPFHMWVPDVYEGSPTPIAAFMAAGVKISAFSALMRLTFVGLSSLKAEWTEAVWWIAALTMTLGNLAAIRQTNLKRMLAYSSIAHAGYLLIALVVAEGAQSASAISSALFYFAAYSMMTLGAFAIVASFQREGKETFSLVDTTGFGFREPLLGASMALFLLSLAGIPPTAGFLGKFLLFKSALDAGYVSLVVLAVLNSAFSVYYYLRPIVYMYMRPGSFPLETDRSFLFRLGVVIPALAVVILGIAPSKCLEIVAASAQSLLQALF